MTYPTNQPQQQPLPGFAQPQQPQQQYAPQAPALMPAQMPQMQPPAAMPQAMPQQSQPPQSSGFGAFFQTPVANVEMGGGLPLGEFTFIVTEADFRRARSGAVGVHFGLSIQAEHRWEQPQSTIAQDPNRASRVFHTTIYIGSPKDGPMKPLRGFVHVATLGHQIFGLGAHINDWPGFCGMDVRKAFDQSFAASPDDQNQVNIPIQSFVHRTFRASVRMSTGSTDYPPAPEIDWATVAADTQQQMPQAPAPMPQAMPQMQPPQQAQAPMPQAMPQAAPMPLPGTAAPAPIPTVPAQYPPGWNPQTQS